MSLIEKMKFQDCADTVEIYTGFIYQGTKTAHLLNEELRLNRLLDNQ